MAVVHRLALVCHCQADGLLSPTPLSVRPSLEPTTAPRFNPPVVNSRGRRSAYRSPATLYESNKVDAGVLYDKATERFSSLAVAAATMSPRPVPATAPAAVDDDEGFL